MLSIRDQDLVELKTPGNSAGMGWDVASCKVHAKPARRALRGSADP